MSILNSKEIIGLTFFWAGNFFLLVICFYIFLNSKPLPKNFTSKYNHIRSSQYNFSDLNWFRSPLFTHCFVRRSILHSSDPFWCWTTSSHVRYRLVILFTGKSYKNNSVAKTSQIPQTSDSFALCLQKNVLFFKK